MAIVPIRQGEGASPSTSSAPTAPPEVYQLMAAAQMHSEGRLVQPELKPEAKTKPKDKAS